MGYPMSGFIAGTCRKQITLFPDRLDNYIVEIWGKISLPIRNRGKSACNHLYRKAMWPPEAVTTDPKMAAINGFGLEDRT